MIKLYDSEIIDILPSHFRNDPDVQAMSYALKRMNQKILDDTKKIGVYCAIENLDEAILDLLAIELRTHYYNMTLPIKIKREIIKNTLKWYSKAGTPAAIEELVTIVFGAGKVKEWFEYDGEPSYFKVEVTNIEVDEEKNKEFKRLLNQAKRISAHLDAINYKFEDVIRNLIYYKNTIQIKSEFYPRANIPYLKYDGTARYDGSVRYSKYKSNERIELYPIKLNMKSEVKPRIIFLPKIQMKSIFQVPIKAEHKISCQKKFAIDEKIETKISIKQENVVLPRYEIKLKIGKHPNKYDGTARYDGRSRYYVEKEENL